MHGKVTNFFDIIVCQAVEFLMTIRNNPYVKFLVFASVTKRAAFRRPFRWDLHYFNSGGKRSRCRNSSPT